MHFLSFTLILIFGILGIFDEMVRLFIVCIGMFFSVLIFHSFSIKIIEKLVEAGCEIRGDVFIQSLNSKFSQATDEDWSTEYLEKIISVKIVEDVDEAINHINTFGSGHTESIITNNSETFDTFQKKINSAIILQNASTQYADGGEFGFGAEIGISTDKLHVRGPVGAEHLTSFKYVIVGNGQVRP